MQYNKNGSLYITAVDLNVPKWEHSRNTELDNETDYVNNTQNNSHTHMLFFSAMLFKSIIGPNVHSVDTFSKFVTSLSLLKDRLVGRCHWPLTS